MPLTKADRAYLDKKFAKLPTRAELKNLDGKVSKLPTKEDLQDEISNVYIDILRTISTYHPEELKTLSKLLKTRHETKQKTH